MITKPTMKAITRNSYDKKKIIKSSLMHKKIYIDGHMKETLQDSPDKMNRYDLTLANM